MYGIASIPNTLVLLSRDVSDFCLCVGISNVDSLHVHGDLVLSGAGDGHLHVHDLSTMSLLYGLGANEAAVRGIGCTDDALIAVGDDGNAIVYDF